MTNYIIGEDEWKTNLSQRFYGSQLGAPAPWELAERVLKVREFQLTLF
jgi:hypothetical protein